MKRQLVVGTLLFATLGFAQARETVKIQASDGTQVHGEYLPAAGPLRGALLLMHQRDGNTCEYGQYPEALSKQGYAVLAIDLRIGGNSFGCRLRTRPKGVTDIFDVPLDIGAASAWLRQKTKLGKIVLVGSSYSGGMALLYAAQHPEQVAGAAVFSPASIDPDITTDIITGSRKLNVPVLVVAPADETGFPKQLLELMPPRQKTLTVPKVGVHGAVGLAQAGTAQAYQQALQSFLKTLPPLK